MASDAAWPRPRAHHLVARPRRASRLQLGGRREHRRRWPKRVAITTAGIAVALVLLAAGATGYAWYRYGQLRRIRVAGLVPRRGNRPFDVLLVAQGTPAGHRGALGPRLGGQAPAVAADGFVVARVAPATHQVLLLSIPPTTLLQVPDGRAGVSGPNVLEATLGAGPSLLVETIERELHLPITYYVGFDLQGLKGLVDSLGGVRLDFADPVRDPSSGLEVDRTGCRLLDGAEALALYRSDYLYYFAHGRWGYATLSGASRLGLQATLLEATASRLQGAVSDPIAMYSFLAVAAHEISVDDSLSATRLVGLALMLRDLRWIERAQVLPTAPGVVRGREVAVLADGPDRRVISRFLELGAAGRGTPPRPGVVPRTTVPGSPAVSPRDLSRQSSSEPWGPAPCKA